VHLQERVTSEVIHAEKTGHEQLFGVRFETSGRKILGTMDSSDPDLVGGNR
jgi:hypothetical protein